MRRIGECEVMVLEQRSPSENGLVGNVLQNLLLKANKRITTLSIRRGHVDSEDAHD